jgi:hypothetical protein
MNQDENLRAYAARFYSLFLESDLVKFARFVPETTAAASLVPRARELIYDSSTAQTINQGVTADSEGDNELSI